MVGKRSINRVLMFTALSGAPAAPAIAVAQGGAAVAPRFADNIKITAQRSPERLQPASVRLIFRSFFYAFPTPQGAVLDDSPGLAVSNVSTRATGMGPGRAPLSALITRSCSMFMLLIGAAIIWLRITGARWASGSSGVTVPLRDG